MVLALGTEASQVIYGGAKEILALGVECISIHLWTCRNVYQDKGGLVKGRSCPEGKLCPLLCPCPVLLGSRPNS